MHGGLVFASLVHRRVVYVRCTRNGAMCRLPIEGGKYHSCAGWANKMLKLAAFTFNRPQKRRRYVSYR